VKFFLNIYEWLQKNAKPPSAFSWETLILLSFFSWYMTVLASADSVKYLLNNLGWIFLIFGVYWATTSAHQLRVGYKFPTNPGFPLSPWITGALVSIYLFGGAVFEVRREALIYWPIISAVIALLPDFLKETPNGGMTLKKPPLDNRQNLVVLFGTQLLLSCWFQFHFLVQDWLVQYPSLLADDVQNSAFVVKFNPPTSQTSTRGVNILESMEARLKERLDGKPWSEIERSLLPEERAKLINTVEDQVKQQNSPILEDGLWQVKSGVSTRKSGYNLGLKAIYQGPRAQSTPYSLDKACQITQVFPRRSAATKPINAKQSSPGTPISRFNCGGVKGWGVNNPKRANDTFIR
jgi:hypothetical protein